MAGLATAGGESRFDGDVDRAQRGARCLQEGLPGLRQRDAPGRAIEQLHPQLELQLRDRRAQRLLRRVEALGRPGEVELLGHRDEIPQVPQLDVHGRRL